MVGSAIARQLAQQGDVEVVTQSRTQLDLCDQAAVAAFLKKERPDQVYLAAAKVGGTRGRDVARTTRGLAGKRVKPGPAVADFFSGSGGVSRAVVALSLCAISFELAQD